MSITSSPCAATGATRSGRPSRATASPSSIFYPTPLHRQPAYEAANRGTSLPASEAAAKTVLSLPIHPLLDEASVDRICARVEAALA